MRQCLDDLGHPQNPTPIIYDNQVAGNLLNGTSAAKRSKVTAINYYWLQERIEHKEINLMWKQYGVIGLGTYITIKSSVFVGSYLMFQYNIIHPETLYIPYFSNLLHIPDILDWIGLKLHYNIPSGHKTDSVIGALALTKLGWYLYVPFSLWLIPKISAKLKYKTVNKSIKN